jgi:hypothetical protein
MATSFSGEVLTATHNFGVAPTRASTAADTFKAALYLTSATINASTTAYSATGEVSGTNYSAGGVTVTNRNCPGFDKHILDGGHGILDTLCIDHLYHGDPDHGI